MPPLPFTDVSFSLINQQLYRTSNAQYNLNDAEGRKLASTGNSGSSTVSNQPISVGNFRGRARFRGTITTRIQNPSMQADANAATRYSAGRTWASYVVNSSGVIGSTSNTVPSLIVNSFSSGDIVDISVNAGGYIVGAGGRGSRGGGTSGNPDSGQPGGTAIQLGFPTSIINAGTIGGGGGGGGGGSGDTPNFGSDSGGGGGGGGAGYLTIYTGTPQADPVLNPGDIQGGFGGSGGGVPGGNDGGPGSEGSLTTGGARGQRGSSDSGWGGRGGDLGQPGVDGSANGDENNNTPGGPGGAAIVGTGFLLSLVNTGTIAGGQLP